MNPSQLHAKLRDEHYQTKFFAFFDDIIHHHLPDIDVVLNPKFEPRVKRPPEIPKPVEASSPEDVLKMMNEWESVFATEVKKCGEVLQRHHCRLVCHKYGNED